MNMDSYHKLKINGNDQSCEKWKCWLLTLKVKLWSTLYSNMIWILEKWMQIHAWEVEISQDRENSKKSKC